MSSIEFGSSGGSSQAAAATPPFMVLPSGWDTNWKASKLALNSGGISNLCWFGDSLFCGLAPSTDIAKNASELLYNGLIAKYGWNKYADFWTAYMSPSANIQGSVPWSTFGANVTADFGMGWSTAVKSTAATGVDAQVFTSPYACTNLDIYYLDMVPGSFQYRIDGGGANTVNMTSPALSQANTELKRIRLTGLSNTVHVIHFDNASAATSMCIVGIATYRGTSGGMGYSRMIANGQTSGEYFGLLSTQYPSDRVGLFSNKSPQRDSTAAGTGTFTDFPLTNVGLLVWTLGINDFTNSLGASVSHYLVPRSIFTWLNYAAQKTSVILLLPMAGGFEPGDSSYSNYVELNPGSPNTSAYYQQLLACSEQINAAVISFQAKWWNRSVANGLRVLNNVHFPDAGHLDMYNTLIGIL